MPQIKVIIGPRKKDFFTKETLVALDKELTKAVEESFCLIGLNDTAFTAILALCTIREADIQIEINYTAGKDEYNQGKLFNPSANQQKALIRKIKSAFDEFCINYEIREKVKLSPVSLSVWCIPHYDTTFKVFEK